MPFALGARTGSEGEGELGELPGLESFDQLGLCLLDVVAPTHWENADADGRQQLAIQLHDQVRAIWRLPASPLETVDSLGKGVRGSFNRTTGGVRVARWLFDGDAGQTLATLVHENRHNLQRDVMRGDIPHPAGIQGKAETERWREGMRLYRRYRGDTTGYAYNPVETDARAAASGVLVAYWRGAYQRSELRRGGDAGD